MAITDIAELSKLVATTVASYGDLTGARDSVVLKKLLTDPDGSTKFSDLEADEFIRTYEFVDQLPNDDVGFSATVFREKATGKLVFAVRGTQMDDDKINDLLIADIQEISGGYAKSQAVSMYRYFKRLSTPPGQAVGARWRERLAGKFFRCEGDRGQGWGSTVGRRRQCGHAAKGCAVGARKILDWGGRCRLSAPARTRCRVPVRQTDQHS